MHFFENFKNFAKAQINLFQPLTILIGKNGAGKTNLIEGMEVFAHLAQGTPLHQFSDVGKGGKCEVRGGLGNCVGFRHGRNFNLRLGDARITLSNPKRRHFDFDYSINVENKKNYAPVLMREELTLQEKGSSSIRTLFSAQRKHGATGTLDVRYDNFYHGPNPNLGVSSERSVLSRYEEITATDISASPKRKDAREVVDFLRKYLQASYIFDPDPKSMRGYERIIAVDDHAELSRNGSNLSAILHAVLKKGDKEKLHRITKVISHLPEEPFADIDFAVTPLRDVMLGFYASGNGGEKRLIDARLLSDGTLRMLAVLTALETAPEHSRIVVEEFDNGLHPSRVNNLVSHVAETAIRRRLNILITTHNPAFMNALDDKQMKSVVLCHRDSQSGYSNLTRLMEVPDADIMMLGGSLGDLVTREVVEKYLASDAIEKRRESIRRWQERART